MYVNPTMDLMSMRSFTKLKLRKSLEGQRFTHWLPLFFGEREVFTIESKEYNHESKQMVLKTQKVDQFERFEAHVNNTMNFLSNGSTRKNHTAEQAMHFMLKLIGTHVVDILSESRHTSIVAIRRLFNFFRLFFYFLEKHPQIQESIETKILEFVSNPEKRHKDTCKNLLDYQIMALLSKKVDYTKFKEAYCDELLDRQVLWILKKIPELDFENKKLKGMGMGVKEEERSKVSFECGKTGFFISVFFVRLNSVL